MKKLIEVELLKDFHGLKKGQKTTKYSRDIVKLLIEDGVVKISETKEKVKKEK